MEYVSDRRVRDHGEAEGAAPACRTASLQMTSTNDIDEQAALLRGWNQTYDQLSSGSFDGAFLEVNLGNALLFREVTSNALHQLGELPKGAVAVGVPITHYGNALFCGSRCDGRQLHVFSGNDAFEFFSPTGLDIAGFVISEEDLFGALSPERLEKIIPTLLTPHLRAVDQGAAGQLHMLFHDVCEVIGGDDAPRDDPARLALMARDVRDAVISALVDSNGEAVALPSARRARIVRQARELVIENPERYASVEELCRALNLSRRALQQAFQETLGLRPNVYLRAVRMNGARRAMRYAASVADVATLWGFWHFGRFAHDYKTMFGELPSESFRRYHE